jgi:GT2 family glycosyltransferase
MLISVVVPTRNRVEILEKALRALNAQDFPAEQFEVVVVDDGSSDGTSARILAQLSEYQMKATLLRQAERGPAAARNLAVRHARGELILFFNDDVIATSGLLEEHFAAHEREQNLSVGVLGRVHWSPEVSVTPFMHWLEHGGPQFKYNEIKPGETSWRNFWTCNLSLRRRFLFENGMFDEDFPFAAWEDIELGYRLSRRGLKLIYNPAALAYHHHPVTLESSRKKMLVHGWSAAIMDRKVSPEAKPSSLKSPQKQILRMMDTIFFCKPAMFVLWRMAKWAEDRVNLGFLFNAVTLHYRLEGQRKAELVSKTAVEKN